MENYEIEHIARLCALAPECMVLLKKDGQFPLTEPCRIALYGNGARHTVKGGGGSGDVHVRTWSNIEQALEDAGFTVTTQNWLDAYEREREKARALHNEWVKEKIAKEGLDTLMENFSYVPPEIDYELPPDGDGEAALYILTRSSSEGSDRLDRPGDISLTDTEIRDILTLNEKHERFLLVLNVGGMVDISPVCRVKNILLLSQLGSVTGESFVDVLLGRANPSGKLAASWYRWSDRPDLGDFGGRDDTRYREGIYVGYRYFDTAGIEPIFPFGYGLSYTEFEQKPGTPSLQGSKVTLPVTVTNMGDRPGKETVQLYVSLPEGRLDQPEQVLAAFAKTRELRPGEQETLTLSFSMESLASFDTERALRILEAGDTLLRVGSSSRDTVCAGTVRLDREAVVERVSHVGGEADFVDWQGTRRERIPVEPILSLSADDLTEREHHAPEISGKALSLMQKLSDEELCYLLTGDFADESSLAIIGEAALTVCGAAGETTGRYRSLGVSNLILSDGPAGLRLARDYGVDEKGMFPIAEKHNGKTETEEKLEMLPDTLKTVLASLYGGLGGEERQGEIHHQYCTAIPVATAIAQSWNGELAAACGEIVAEEMERFGIDVWLAPGMNIQRDPLCGRNFEYYSEDPLLTGHMAAAVTKGVQKHPGRSVTIKHFVCNNQETNRFRSNSIVSERALRDIYAKGFEIVVREAQPHAIMSSYNLLNGVHPSEREDLLETLLREEWGFEGIVMSDWLPGDEASGDKTNKYRKFWSVPSAKAGLDVLMPGCDSHYNNLLGALRSGELSRERAEKSAARMVEFAWKLKERG